MHISPTRETQRIALAPAGTRLYAVGDIHGCKELLDRMLAAILSNAERSQAKRCTVIFLGDYIDRGPQARAVIETLMTGPPTTSQWARFQWICLRGNHEAAMLRFLEESAAGPNWLANGGLPTIESYIGRSIPSVGIGLGELQDTLLKALPSEHRMFLNSLPYWHVEGDYFFTHAGVRAGIPLDQQATADLLWIRDDFLNSTADYGKIIVHGHTPTPTPEFRRNRIGIDTGACFSGRLTTLVAEEAKRWILTT
jgi:serine/threonine protein phosphatase 1